MCGDQQEQKQHSPKLEREEISFKDVHLVYCYEVMRGCQVVAKPDDLRHCSCIIHVRILYKALTFKT